MFHRPSISTNGWIGHRRRPSLLIFALLAVMSLLAVSCGTDDDAPDAAPDTPSADTSATATETDDAAPEPDEGAAPDDTAAPESEPEESAPEPEETAPEVPAPSGTVRSAPLVSLITMDPHNFSGGGVSWQTPVYESLFRQVRGEDGGISPLLATGYSVDGLEVTITLRDGVTFSDGEPFNAAAVKANLDRGKAVGVRAEFAVIDSVSVADPFTVVVTLAHPAPAFISDLASIPGFMISPAALDDPALDRNPVGTGPWVYNAAESREGEVHVYTLNDNYWNPSAQGVERIEVYDIPDAQARLNALKTGQLDIASVAGPTAAEAGADPSLGLIEMGTNLVLGIPILDRDGTVVPAFASPLVREAMSIAIDRDAWAQVIDFGLGTPNLQPVPKGHWAHNDALDENIEFNPERARQLMAEAGYGDGFSFTMPSIGFFGRQVEVLSEFWRDIGIDMSVEVLEPGTLAGRSRSTDFPITTLFWVVGRDVSAYPGTYLNVGASFNPFGHEPNPRITELDELGWASLNPAERALHYHQMWEIVAEERYVIYITSSDVVLGASAEMAQNPTIRIDAAQAEAPIWHGLRLGG